MRKDEQDSFEKLLVDGDTRTICKALVNVTFDPETDYQWLEMRCTDIMQSHPSAPVRSLAATCLGHIARITGALSQETLDVLRAHQNDESLEGTASDALDDWWMFVGRHLGERT